MANFLAELKRRHVYRVAAGYAVGAWVLLQLVNNVAPVLDLPPWIARATLLFLVLGFPVAVILAWMFDATPEGLKRTAPGTGPKTGAADWILVGALAAVIGLVSYEQLSPTRTMESQHTGVAAARVASATQTGAISIAVLPFTNLSGDASQEFFSDGMTEEITSAIAKIADLRVVGRTSAFQFKGEKKDLRAVGQALNATHLIEGSVRKAGNRVRITVQLVQADSGLQVWTDNYDRDLTDVFAIQEDIARAIAASLRMPLGLKPGENLVNNRSIDPESYEKLLRAKALVDGRIQGAGPTGAAAIFEEVTAKNPGYAPAWGLLAGAYFLIGNADAGNIDLPIAESRERADAFRVKGEAAAQRGLQADHDLARGYFESGLFAWSRAKPLEAEEFFTKALGLDPLSPDALDVYAIRLGAAGRVKDALAVVEKGRAVEPFLPALSLRYAQDLWLDGQDDAAIAQAKTLRPVDRAPLLAMMYAALGRYGEAADALMEVASDPNSAAAQAARLLRTAPAKAPSPDKLPRLPAGLEFTFLHVGAPERALYTYERRAEVGFLGGNATAYVWHPSYAPVRKTERFKTLMRKAGLVEYWRAKGWPAQCHPITGDDFACE